VSTGQPSDFKETVRAQTDIVSLIGETVRLQSVRGGREFVGLCPFHDDSNPSLRVYPDRQSYRCWSCNAGGDCFTFVMESEPAGFREALEILASRAGIAIPKHSGQPAAPGEDRSVLLQALLWAEGLFHHVLLNDSSAGPARKYLADRGFTPETIGQFKLGFHPDDWQWLLNRAGGRFTPDQLTAVGLAKQRDGGTGYIDYFVGRVLFPIHNERGQPVGFGGRVLPGADDAFGKYFNSVESPVFHKSRLVYALDAAREEIKKTGAAVVTEGYTDCITAHQAGLTNVVATLGTALTEMQVTTIKRFAHKVVLVYDGDQAGQSAAARAVARFLAQDVDLRILTLPDGQDPAEFIGRSGPEAFAREVAGAPEAFDYMFSVLAERFGSSTVDGRQRILAGALDVLAGVPRLARNVREDLLLTRLSQRLGISEDLVRQQYQAARTAKTSGPAATNAGRSRSLYRERSAHVLRVLQEQPTRQDRLECELAQIVIAMPKFTARLRQELGVDEISNPAVRAILQAYYDFEEAGEEEQGFARLLSAFDDDPETKQLAVWLDEQGRSKNLEYKLCHDAERGDDECPLILRRLLDDLKWRREEESHHRVAIELTRSGEGAHGLDEETERHLRQLAEFHQKRATKKPKIA
jgi:DNA primase